MEEPTCKVTIVAMNGARSRSQMDEKSQPMMLYPNGKTIFGYGVKMSGEGVEHVRVSEMTKSPQWIRCWERDGTNPLVSIDYIVSDTDRLVKLGEEILTEIRDISKSLRDMAK
jgi:hypothetical protein